MTTITSLDADGDAPPQAPRRAVTWGGKILSPSDAIPVYREVWLSALGKFIASLPGALGDEKEEVPPHHTSLCKGDQETP